VSVNRVHLERSLGLQRERPEHVRWYDTLDRLTVELPRLTRPRAIYRIDPIASLEPDRITLQDGSALRGETASFVEHSQYLARWIVTIGSGLERLSRGWLRAGRMMEGTVADALGSEAAESAAEQIQSAVREWARARGLEITPRFSPGYCRLELDQQPRLFAGLPARRINVRLLPSLLMLPLKSISGIIGIGPAGKVSPTRYPCAQCDRDACPYRRA
jgi:hypothetical protein